MSYANSTQVGGQHYKSTYEHWDFVRQCLDGRYLEGCITKYVARHRKKNGLQDLQKARHYLTKLREEFKLGNVEPLRFFKATSDTTSASAFADRNGLSHIERDIVNIISAWANVRDLSLIGNWLDDLIVEEQKRADSLAAQGSPQSPERVTRIDEDPRCLVLYYDARPTDATVAWTRTVLKDALP